MVIGFFTEGYLPQLNGVAISVAASVKALEKRGHTVYVFAPQFPDYEDKREHIIRLPSVNVNKSADFRFATIFSGKSLMKASKIDFDIIHGHSGGPVTMLGWQVARLKGIPYVLTYHTMWSKYTHYILNGKVVDSNMVEMASKIFGNWSTSIIAPSQKIKVELKKYGVDKPITIISSGVDVDAFSVEEKGFLKKKLGLPEKSRIVLYVGRLGKEKSVTDLLDIFSLVEKKVTDASLVLVGEGDEKRAIIKKAKALSLERRVYLTGSIDPELMPYVYADADVFIFASRTETQGMVVLEAMAAGLPIVVIDDPAFRVAIQSQKNGILAEDIPSFAQSVEKVLLNEKFARQLGQEARKTAERNSVDEMAKKLERYYIGIMKKDRKKRFSLKEFFRGRFFPF